MSLIEQLGGYEEAKDTQRQRALSGLLHDYDWELHSALLEHRRQHNIFEESDKIVFVDDFMHGELMTISLSQVGEVWMDEGSKRCSDLSMIRHATDEEIKAGKRLSTV